MVDEASVAVLREAVRERGAAHGLPATVTASLVNIASELGHNQWRHARVGYIDVRAIERDGVCGLEIIATDRGPGIRDPEAAFAAAGRIQGSFGVGLAAVRELTDELDVDVRMGEGTTIRARKFATRVPRMREVGILGRPFRGEDVSGDDAYFARNGRSLTLALADGLGHGPEARRASARALQLLFRQPQEAIETRLDSMHHELRDTRGTVLSVVELDETSGALTHTAVGNTTLLLAGPGTARRFSGSSFVLGAAGKVLRPATDDAGVGPRDCIILFSDGIAGRAQLSLEDILEPPIVIAQRIVDRFARDSDDALVLVAR